MQLKKNKSAIFFDYIMNLENVALAASLFSSYSFFPFFYNRMKIFVNPENFAYKDESL
jgi:hypothetical protein